MWKKLFYISISIYLIWFYGRLGGGCWNPYMDYYDLLILYSSNSWSFLLGNIGICWGAWTFQRSCISDGCTWLHCFSWKWCIYSFVLRKHGEGSWRSPSLSWTQEDDFSWQARTLIFWVDSNITLSGHKMIQTEPVFMLILFHQKSSCSFDWQTWAGNPERRQKFIKSSNWIAQETVCILSQNLWSSTSIALACVSHFVDF